MIESHLNLENFIKISIITLIHILAEEFSVNIFHILPLYNCYNLKCQINNFAIFTYKYLCRVISLCS